MFKESLSALTSSVIGATKQSLSEYKPNAQNMGGAFTRIAQQGIANLSFRSPLLADLASTMLHSFQMELVNREKIKSYVGSEDSKDFRESIQKQLGPNASKDKIDHEMFTILDKLEKLVEKEGTKAASSNDLFKKNEDHFKKFLDSFKTETKKESAGASGVQSPELLQRIEANTLHTVQALEEMRAGGASPAAGTASPGTTPTGEAPRPASFVDPFTGMPSIRAAIGGIGGTFLAKVFDDETISKYASKTRERIFGKTEQGETVASPKRDDISDLKVPEIVPKTMPSARPTHEQSVADILKDLSLDLTTIEKKDDAPNIENSRESSVQAMRQHTTTKTLQEQTVEQLKLLNDKTLKKEESSTSIFSGITKMLGEFGPLVGRIAPILGSLGSVLMAIAPAVGAVGLGAVAGVAIGTAAKETIDYGISKATGSEETLGGWLHDQFNEDPMAKMAKDATRISPKTSPKVAPIEKIADKISANKKSSENSASAAPVAINTTTNNSSNTNVLIGNNVRNQESTFERVQMANYWGAM